ncbi:LuxR C-terminal-related transcriptional regulator [Kribbella sp. NPDC056861]|uniref:helix-turn-helix transcriptional regulator n=1 Tax=Kribbella sp. NPDC056861 TaxID=3154857 RepID=UPI00343EB86A
MDAITLEPDRVTAATLATAIQIVQGKPGDTIEHLSAALAEQIPHRVAAQLSTQCAATPLTSTGDAQLAKAITGADLAPLIGYVTAGRPWQGRFRIDADEYPVLAVSSDLTARGSVLVLVLYDDAPVAPAAAEYAQSLWDLATAHMYRLTQEAAPTVLAQSRAVAMARSTAIAELSEAHAAAFATLLGVMRNGRLDDATARATAVDVALNALIDLRADSRRDRADSGEEPLGRAFQRLAESLRSLLRHDAVQLELDAPSNDNLLPAALAHTARVAVRAVVLAMLRQDGVRRIRVGWQLVDGGLQATIRDDGPGRLDDDLELGQLAERLHLQHGHLDIDAVPGWGLTVKLNLPVEPKTPSPATSDPMAGLGDRELEVLEHLAQGHRNRTIADNLHISESTVKFHVANILTKLEVSSRGEAAALFHSVAL